MKTFKTPKGTELPLRDMRGKDYLDVQYRVLWMREEHADWGIQTEFLSLSPEGAIAHATIRDAMGKILAQGTKSENPKGFEDYIEKAETGAIGRALALCGYGTQFAQELEEGERIVDSPREPKGAPSNVAPIRPAEGDLGAYVLPFGKYQGKRLAEIGHHDLDNYFQWMKKNQKPGQKDSEGMQAIDAFLKSREVPRVK